MTNEGVTTPLKQHQQANLPFGEASDLAYPSDYFFWGLALTVSQFTESSEDDLVSSLGLDSI